MPATKSPAVPRTVKPMLAYLTRQPFDSAEHLFELKWDGIRTIAFVRDGEVRLQSRNLNNITSSFPEMEAIAKAVKGRDVVLDGELVCFEDGKPSFQRMQQRLQRQHRGLLDPGPQAHYIAFDLLYVDGESVMRRPLAERKNMLNDLVTPRSRVQTCEFIDAEGVAFFDAICEHGLEGIVAKRKDGIYQPGHRSKGWQKIKRVREAEFVIGGYDFGGARDEFSSLLLGLYDDKRRLRYVGHCGTGFSNVEAKYVRSLLDKLHVEDSPFRVDSPTDREKFTFWCKPELVCRVQYGEFTTNGRLRYPAFLALRDDKSPKECRTEDAPGWPVDLSITR